MTRGHGSVPRHIKAAAPMRARAVPSPAMPGGQGASRPGRPGTRDLTRRDVLIASCVGSAAFAGALIAPPAAGAAEEAVERVEQLFGRALAASDRVHLVMPAEFPTGYTVPMDLHVDSPMSDDDHVRSVRVFAPENPIMEVAGFNFVPRRSVPRVSTRIRLAKPQYVVAVAEMNDGMLLTTRTWVDVATDGCA
jgi:sulfur-oxidizing protein SoxY